MDTLNAVRTHKSAFATAVSQAAPEGSTATEVKQLKLQLKAREIEDAKMRTDVKELNDTVARLQAQLETQQQSAADRPSAEDLDRRLGVLEVARQAADTWQSQRTKELSDISAQQQTLHMRINETEKSCTASVDKGIEGINQDLRGLRQTHEPLCKDVSDYIGPIRQAYVAANKFTLLQRVASLDKEQGHLSSQMESLSSRPFVKQEEFEALKSAVGNLKVDKQAFSQDIDTKITHLSNAHDHLSTCVKELAEDKTVSTKDSVDNHAVADFKERLLEVEKLTTNLREELDELRTKGEDLKTLVEVNETEFFGIFGEKFDPLITKLEDHKTATEKKLQSMNERLQLTEEEKSSIDEKLGSCDRTLTELSQSMNEQRQESERKLLQQVGEVKQDLAHLRDDITTETTQLKAATGSLNRALASKQDTAEASNLIEAVRFAVESLQRQYDNISTEDLCSKMGHWVLQQYPNSTAAVLQQLAGFQYDLDQLRSFTDHFSQMPNSAQALVALAKLEPQIVALVKAPPGSVQSQEVTAKLDKRLRKLESKEMTVSGLQGSLNALTSDNSPLVQKEFVEQSITKLRDEMETAVCDLRTEFKQTDDALHQQVQEVVLESKKISQIAQISTQVESLQQDAAQLRREMDKALEDINDPATSHCILQLPVLFTHAGQLQVAVETLSANLPRGPLKYKWDHDLKEMFPVSSPFTF